MRKPELQNDFSFYRRSLGSSRLAGLATPVSSDNANVVSNWIAYSLPMLNLIKSKNVGAVTARPLGNLCNALCGMLSRAGACELAGLERPRAVQHMLAALLLYDRSSPAGAFISSSPLKVSHRLVWIMSRK